MENNDVKHTEIDYWIACSGGLDSVFLVHLFVSMNKKVGLLHCNFKLRGEESDGDEVFVRKLAKELNIPIQVNVFDTIKYKEANNTNTQLAARNLRYAWFDEVKNATNALIVLGHHRDDQRETFILQLLRGASVHGLATMPFERNGYIRPLLGYTKDDLRSISLHNGWTWREDSSNLQDDYTRNDLRHHLIPELVRNGLNLQLIDELVRNYQQLLKHIESTKIQLGEEEYEIPIQDWREMPVFYQNVLLEDLGFGKNNRDLAIQVSESNKGAFALRNDIELWNEGIFLLFRRSKELPKLPELIVEPINRSNLDFQSSNLFVDAEKIQGNLYLRYWEEGDEFSPLGMIGNKKVSDFLKDKNVRSSEKKNQLAVCDDLGIVGVIGFVPSNRVKITEFSKQFFKLAVNNSV